MSDYITALGWIVALVGGLGIVAVLAWLAIEAWWRIYHRAHCVKDLIDAVKEWRKNHPEKAKAYDNRVEKAR